MLLHKEMKLPVGQRRIQEKLLYHVTTESIAMESLNSGLHWRRTHCSKSGEAYKSGTTLTTLTIMLLRLEQGHPPEQSPFWLMIIFYHLVDRTPINVDYYYRSRKLKEFKLAANTYRMLRGLPSNLDIKVPKLFFWQRINESNNLLLMRLQLSPDHNDCYPLGADNKICRTSMNGNKQSCVWEVNIMKDIPLKPNAFMSQAFTLDQSGGYMLLCHSQNNGGNIYKITSTGLNAVISKSMWYLCDWFR